MSSQRWSSSQLASCGSALAALCLDWNPSGLGIMWNSTALWANSCNLAYCRNGSWHEGSQKTRPTGGELNEHLLSKLEVGGARNLPRSRNTWVATENFAKFAEIFVIFGHVWNCLTFLFWKQLGRLDFFRPRQVGFSTMSSTALVPLICYSHPNGQQSNLKHLWRKWVLESCARSRILLVEFRALLQVIPAVFLKQTLLPV